MMRARTARWAAISAAMPSRASTIIGPAATGKGGFFTDTLHLHEFAVLGRHQIEIDRDGLSSS